MSKLFYLERIKVLNRSKIKIKQREENNSYRNNNHCVIEREREEKTTTTTMIIVVRFGFAQRAKMAWNALA